MPDISSNANNPTATLYRDIIASYGFTKRRLIGAFTAALLFVAGGVWASSALEAQAAEALASINKSVAVEVDVLEGMVYLEGGRWADVRLRGTFEHEGTKYSTDDLMYGDPLMEPMPSELDEDKLTLHSDGENLFHKASALDAVDGSRTGHVFIWVIAGFMVFVSFLAVREWD